MPNRKYENNEQELIEEERETLKWSLLPLRAPLGPGSDIPDGPEGFLRLWSLVLPQLLLSAVFPQLLFYVPSAPAFSSLAKPGSPCDWSFGAAAGLGFGKPGLI